MIFISSRNIQVSRTIADYFGCGAIEKKKTPLVRTNSRFSPFLYFTFSTACHVCMSLKKGLTFLCSVAVTRMKDVPPFGPPIPSGFTFRDPETFRNFLLAKVINAENAAHKSEKFHTMATRTRQEYLRDLAENYISNTPLDSAGKLNNLISLASKKRERSKAREGAEFEAAGCVAWRVLAQDFSGGGAELACALGLSAEYVLLIDCSTKEVVFNCFCADVIGWTPERLALKIFYGRGDHIAVRVPEGCAQDIREMVQRLKVSAQCSRLRLLWRL